MPDSILKQAIEAQLQKNDKVKDIYSHADKNFPGMEFLAKTTEGADVLADLTSKFGRLKGDIQTIISQINTGDEEKYAEYIKAGNKLKAAEIRDKVLKQVNTQLNNEIYTKYDTMVDNMSAMQRDYGKQDAEARDEAKRKGFAEWTSPITTIAQKYNNAKENWERPGAYREGKIEAIAKSPIIELEKDAKIGVSEGEQAAIAKGQLKVKGTTDLGLTDAKGNWDLKSAVEQAGGQVNAAQKNKEGQIRSAELGLEGQKYQARYSALAQIAGSKIQGEAQLQGILLTHAEDFTIGIKTEYEKSNLQALANGQGAWQDKARGRLATDLYEYQVDLVSPRRGASDMDKMALKVMSDVDAKKEDIVEEYKKQHGGKLGKVTQIDDKGNKTQVDLKADDVVELVKQTLVSDVFHKYESKIQATDFKTVNGLQYKNGNLIDGVEYYINDINDRTKGIIEGDLGTKVLSRKINDQDASKYDVKISFKDSTGKIVEDTKTIDKNKVFAKININTSGLGSNFYVAEEEAKDILFNSSGNRIDGIFGTFKNKINNKEGLTEEQKEKQLAVTQNGLEAVFGGDNKLWGLVSLLISGQFKMFVQSIKEVFRSGKTGFQDGEAQQVAQSNATQQATNTPEVKQAIMTEVKLSDNAIQLKDAIKDSNLAVDEKGKLKKVFNSEAEVHTALQSMAKSVEDAGGIVDTKKLDQLSKDIATGLSITGGASVKNNGSPTVVPTNLDTSKDLIATITKN